VSNGLKNSATPAAAAIARKIAVAPMQISNFLRKMGKNDENQNQMTNDKCRTTKLE
jgi:hypothetical protein